MNLMFWKEKGSSVKPKITKREFEKAYAERSEVTVAWLKKNGRVAERCNCDEEICDGWQMAHKKDEYGWSNTMSSGTIGGVAEHVPPDDELEVEVGVEGWREMTLCADDEGMYLLGNYGGKLRSRESDEAECDPSGGNNWITIGSSSEPKLPKHKAPHKKCTCGFYALSNPSLGYMQILARVSAAGKTIKAASGFRTARIRVEELFVSEQELIAPLSEQFEVPVSLRKELLWRLVKPRKSSAPSPSPTS